MEFLCTFPCPERSSSIRPFSVPINRLTPHNAAHSISELKRFLYLRISGVSLVASCDVGVTLTFICDSRRVGPEPPAPKPNVRKLRCFCCSAYACGGKLADVDGGVEMLEEEEADLCNKLVILLVDLVLLIEFFGLFCRDDDDNEIVDCGELFELINDFDGVECTDELMAA